MKKAAASGGTTASIGIFQLHNYTNSKMVRIACVIIDSSNHRQKIPRAATAAVDVELTMTVADFTDLVHPPLEEAHHFTIHKLQLYYAQREDGSWPDYSEALKLQPNAVEQTNRFMEPSQRLSEYFGDNFQPQARGEFQVFVLGTFRPHTPGWMRNRAEYPNRRTPKQEFAHLLKCAHYEGQLPGSLDDADPDLWTTDDIVTTKDLSAWRAILPSLPPTFYVRLEVLMVWEVFRGCLKKRLDKENGVDVRSDAYQAAHRPDCDLFSFGDRILLLGTVGIGKGVLITLLSLWLAVKQRRDVVLFANSGDRQRVTLLSGQSGRYYLWEESDAGVAPLPVHVGAFVQLLKHSENRGRVWACADSLCYASLVRFDVCSSFYTVSLPGYDWFSLRQCLLPFWTQSDLKTVGQLRGFDADECERRYAVSGGSLGLFLRETSDAKAYIDGCLVDPASDSTIRLRRPRTSYERVIDMPTVLDRSCLVHYMGGKFWRKVMTSAYARERMGFGDMLWSIFSRKYKTDNLAL